MLTATTCRWQSVEYDEADAIKWKDWVVSTVVSGVDLAAHLVVDLRREQTETASRYVLQSTAFPETKLRPQNLQALALLQSWVAEPDDLDDEWWDEFEQDLQRYRFTLRDSE